MSRPVLRPPWVLLSYMHAGDEVTEVMAAADFDGIGVLCIWRADRDGDWSCWAVDTEMGENHEPDDDDEVPAEPPFDRGGG